MIIDINKEKRSWSDVRSRLPERIDQLTNLGVIPRAVLRLTQRRPSVVVECGETVLAVDNEIAPEIYVKPVSKSATAGGP